MKVDVIVGGLYGDEGKGKIVSNLGKNYDYIFRVNASTNSSISRWKKFCNKTVAISIW